MISHLGVLTHTIALAVLYKSGETADSPFGQFPLHNCRLSHFQEYENIDWMSTLPFSCWSFRNDALKIIGCLLAIDVNTFMLRID